MWESLLIVAGAFGATLLTISGSIAGMDFEGSSMIVVILKGK